MGILSLHARTYVHATEDREKVLKALSTVFPEDIRGSLNPSIEVYEGHYGNPIEVVTVDLNDSSLALKTLKYIVDRLSEADRSRLLNTLEERVDRHGGLYIRLSKQEAFRGFIVLEDGDDVIRIHVRFSGGKKEALRYYRELLSS